MQSFPVKANADGTLTAGSGPNVRRYVQVEPLVFQELDGHRRLVFREDDQGRVSHLFFPEVPAVALVRHAALDDTRFHWGLLGGCLAVFATAILFWPTLGFCARGLLGGSIRRTRL